MAASNAKTPQQGKGDSLQEEILQAVVIADRFNTRFEPLTHDVPWVLLPLVNRPLIDYTLEYLHNEGIQEVFILACSHADKLRQHVKNSWTSEAMSVSVISSESYLSEGDMFRDLDCKALIRSDFFLLTGATISNIYLRDVLEQHRKARLKDKGLLMSMIFHKASPKHKTRCLEDDCVVILEQETNKVLHFHKMMSQRKLDFPLRIFQEHSKVMIRHDLLDCHIAVCSPHVLPIFTDNFDFQTRDDFVRDIIVQEEIMGNSIYLHIAEKGYAASVINMSNYDSISRDVIRRWVYPVVPDQLVNIKDRCTYHRYNVYKHKDADLSSECSVVQNTVIGGKTIIGPGTQITDSVIGNRCVIGANVKLNRAYIWDDVHVGNNCTLDTCILANDVVLKENVSMSPGCVLSKGVVVGPRIVLKNRTFLQSELPEDDFETEEKTVAEYDPALVGLEGKGYLYSTQADSDEEYETELQDIWGQELPEEEDALSVITLTEDEASEPATPPPDDTRSFYNEVMDSLQRGVEEKVTCDNLILEINSSKYAYNVTMKEVNSLVTKVILELPTVNTEHVQAQEYFSHFKKILKQFKPLFKNYIKSDESQMDCLLALEDFAICNTSVHPALVKIVNELYDSDVLGEDAILEWFSKPKPLADHDAAEQKEVRNFVQPFVKWLQEAEDESDDSE